MFGYTPIICPGQAKVLPPTSFAARHLLASRSMRRLLSGLVALALVAVACSGDDGPNLFERLHGADGTVPAAASVRTDLDAYEGLGTWVDVYDYVSEFQDPGEVPAVTPKTVDDMARLGVKTLFLQAAQDDARSPGDTIDTPLLAKFVRAGHEAGVQVVAWYLPRFADTAADLRRIRALLDFDVDGQRFDGLALDIEWTDGVPDPAARDLALIELSREVRSAAGDRPVGAVVLDPIHLEVVNQDYWPNFPWRELAPLYDVWLPMTYWTNRSKDSGYRDGFAYTDENIRRLRNNLDEPDAPVHPVGGIGDAAHAADYDGFVRAARAQHAIGWSVYDFNVTASSVWARLRA